MNTRTGENVDRRTSGPSPSNPDEPIRTTRVDHGHVAANGSATADEAASQAARADAVLAADDVHTLAGAAALAEDVADERAEIEAHARQLGLKLAARQAELDAREEELNRRLAEFDQEMRRSRIWLDARRREIEEREVENGTRRADVEARLERILAGERELQAERREQLERREGGAALDAAEGKVPASDAEPPSVPESAFVSVEVRPPDYAARLRRLDQAEALAAAEHEAIAEARRHLDADRAAAQQNLAAERREWSEQQARREALIDRRERDLRERSEQLDARAKSLDALRRDLAAGQRETLEMRVAVQELWLSLSGRIAPAAMLQALAESRAKLATEYRQHGSEFDAAEKRLRDAGERLAEQIAHIKEQRQAFESWAGERQTAIERQAARLVAREQELEAESARRRDQEHAWNEQRLAYRREIRRLLAELRSRDRAGDFAALHAGSETD
ncbi:MAG: hypothetical protein DCC68_23120 [Planctomycetota bacterium]|nr:MAG: hypothetical protein DCC68_23120 [Planctomycetota bacterium]